MPIGQMSSEGLREITTLLGKFSWSCSSVRGWGHGRVLSREALKKQWLF